MNKVTFSVDVDDNLLDAASKSLLKNKIRQYVEDEINTAFEERIRDEVERSVNRHFNSLKTRTREWTHTDADMQIEKIIINKINDISITKDDVSTYIESYVGKYVNQYITNIIEIKEFPSIVRKALCKCLIEIGTQKGEDE